MWNWKQRFKVKVNSSDCGNYVKSIERINSDIFKINFKGIGNYQQYPVGEGAPYTLLPLCFFWHQYTVHTTILLYCMWSQVPIRVFPLYYHGSSVQLSLMEFQVANQSIDLGNVKWLFSNNLRYHFLYIYYCIKVTMFKGFLLIFWNGRAWGLRC